MTAKPGTPEFDKFDEYKFFIDDTARLSERRQDVTSAYIGINSGILGVVSLIILQDTLTPTQLALASIPVIAAGLVVCFFWNRLLLSYKRLLGFRFHQLEEMEAQIDGCHKMYARETAELYEKAPKKSQIEFSKIEAGLPFMFGGLYLVFFTGMVVAAF
jgi:hypothetical protein